MVTRDNWTNLAAAMSKRSLAAVWLLCAVKSVHFGVLPENGKSMLVMDV